MKRTTLPSWLGVGLLGLGLTTGCHQFRPQTADGPAHCPADPGIVQAAAWEAAPPAARADDSRREAVGQPRAQMDLTGSTCLGRGPDYAWLSGQVEYSRLGGGTWRLRYASVDEEDRYGGSVTLVENAGLDRLRDGQRVIVQGHLSNPDDTRPAPAYRVDWFRVLGDGSPAAAAP